MIENEYHLSKITDGFVRSYALTSFIAFIMLIIPVVIFLAAGMAFPAHTVMDVPELSPSDVGLSSQSVYPLVYPVPESVYPVNVSFDIPAVSSPQIMPFHETLFNYALNLFTSFYPWGVGIVMLLNPIGELIMFLRYRLRGYNVELSHSKCVLLLPAYLVAFAMGTCLIYIAGVSSAVAQGFSLSEFGDIVSILQGFTSMMFIFELISVVLIAIPVIVNIVLTIRENKKFEAEIQEFIADSKISEE